MGVGVDVGEERELTITDTNLPHISAAFLSFQKSIVMWILV
jgi:hypothetical protein